MAKPRVCVLRAPGTNCEVETTFAFQTAGADAEHLHLNRVLEQPSLLDDFQILCVPGGFSYGDDLGAGVIFSRQLRGRLGDALGRFLQADKLALGICNGFQVLLKAGILPDGAAGWPPGDTPPAATLTWNDNGRYTAVWVKLKVIAPRNVFLRGIEEIELPVAHAEGKIEVREASVLERWRENSQIALCYTRRSTVASTNAASNGPFRLLDYPDNPNGAVWNIAGLGDASGRVMGLMPHPERFIHATQHPRWTRLGLTGEGDGMKIFRNAVEYFG